MTTYESALYVLCPVSWVISHCVNPRSGARCLWETWWLCLISGIAKIMIRVKRASGANRSPPLVTYDFMLLSNEFCRNVKMSLKIVGQQIGAARWIQNIFPCFQFLIIIGLFSGTSCNITVIVEVFLGCFEELANHRGDRICVTRFEREEKGDNELW